MVQMIKPRNLSQALGLLMGFVTVPLLLGALALLTEKIDARKAGQRGTTD